MSTGGLRLPSLLSGHRVAERLVKSRSPALVVALSVVSPFQALVVSLLVCGCIGEYDNDPGSGAAPYAIEGTITEAGVPLAGVTVVFEGTGAPSPAVSGPDGRFRQAHFPSGTYTVRPQDGVHDFYHNGEPAPATFALDRTLSSADFAAVPAGSAVDLLSPNGGGDPVVARAPLAITWRAKGQAGTHVRIMYSEAEGPPWQDVGTFELDPAPLPDATVWQEYSVPWKPPGPTPAAAVSAAVARIV